MWEALKARNRKCSTENSSDCPLPTSFRAFSATKLQLVPPGPMAQAITFRAVGAETQSFHTVSTARGSDLVTNRVLSIEPPADAIRLNL
jgi:hypothetical protein